MTLSLCDQLERIATMIRERNNALIALDLTWARNVMGHHAHDLTLLAAMHKARYDIPSIPDALRHESAAWLRAHKMTGMFGMPLLPPGQLPEGIEP